MATYIEKRHSKSGETTQVTHYMSEADCQWALAVLEEEYGTEDYCFVIVEDNSFEEGN